MIRRPTFKLAAVAIAIVKLAPVWQMTKIGSLR
jgi:hypothetical protein